jgi:hypothetical protein
VLTVSEAGDAIRASAVPERAVVITSTTESQAGRARCARSSGTARRLSSASRATSAAGTTGPQPPAVPALAPPAAELRELGASDGGRGAWHGSRAARPVLRRRLAGAAARTELEAMLGVAVRAFAYPYGIVGRVDAAALAEAGYTSGWAAGAGWISAGSPWHALPRVDAHYLRSPAVLERVLAGRLPGYVEARRIGSAARRAVARTGAWAPR